MIDWDEGPYKDEFGNTLSITDAHPEDSKGVYLMTERKGHIWSGVCIMDPEAVDEIIARLQELRRQWP